MRVTLADAALARYAGRFVWLELDYDNAANQPFLTRHTIQGFPAFFVIDPKDERVTAVQLGAMTAPQLRDFLDRGQRSSARASWSAADAALLRGDEAVGRGQYADGVAAYREALRAGGDGWSERPHAIDQLTAALQANGDVQACAETAVQKAPSLPHDRTFVSVVLAGFACANQGGDQPWTKPARDALRPLAVAACALPAALSDDRFQLYEQRIFDGRLRNDKAEADRVARLWLSEVEAVHPRNDDERAALDVGRVRAATQLGDPARVLPALAESERLMPASYTASARYASMALAARDFDAAIAAARRGLAHAPGAMGRTGLLVTEANALLGKQQAEKATAVLVEALTSARAIGPAPIREANVRRITQLLEAAKGTR